MNFMHFHNSSARNYGYHILLIMTGNAHKESFHKLSFILVREQGLYIIKTDCSGEMVIAFTNKEIKLLKGKPILPIPAALFVLVFVVLRSCFRHSDKSGYCSLSIQFYKLLWLWFYPDFFLNSGFYYNDVEYRRK